jgi:hypothetical protein
MNLIVILIWFSTLEAVYVAHYLDIRDVAQYLCTVFLCDITLCAVAMKCAATNRTTVSKLAEITDTVRTLYVWRLFHIQILLTTNSLFKLVSKTLSNINGSRKCWQ